MGVRAGMFMLESEVRDGRDLRTGLKYVWLVGIARASERFSAFLLPAILSLSNTGSCPLYGIVQGTECPSATEVGPCSART